MKHPRFLNKDANHCWLETWEGERLEMQMCACALSDQKEITQLQLCGAELMSFAKR